MKDKQKERQKYTLEAVQNLTAKLREMPKAEASEKEISKSEAVRLMAKEIKSMQARGYTISMIAEILSKNDFTISESVLKSYLQRASGKVAIKGKTASAKPEPDSPVNALDIKASGRSSPALEKKTNLISDVD